MINSFKIYLENKNSEPLDLSKLKNVDVMENGPGYIFYRALDVEQCQEILKIWPDIKVPLKHSDLLKQYFKAGYFFFFYVTRNKSEFLFFECDDNSILKVVHDVNYQFVKFDTIPEHVKNLVTQFITIDDEYYKTTFHGVYDVDGSMEKESIQTFETFTPRKIITRDNEAIAKGLKLSSIQKMDVIEDFRIWSGGSDPTEVPMEHEEGDDLDSPTIDTFLSYYSRKSKLREEAIEDFIDDLRRGRELIHLYETFTPRKIDARMDTEEGKKAEQERLEEVRKTKATYDFLKKYKMYLLDKEILFDGNIKRAIRHVGHGKYLIGKVLDSVEIRVDSSDEEYKGYQYNRIGKHSDVYLKESNYDKFISGEEIEEFDRVPFTMQLILPKNETFQPRRISDRENSVIGKNVESDKRVIVTVTISVDGNRIPGGSPKQVVEDYDLAEADDGQKGFFTVTGSLWNVRNYLTDYANEFLLDVKFSDEGYGLH